jgi:hypothetical protein
MASYIKSIMEWSTVNQLVINASKTKEILVFFDKVPRVESLYMNETEIEQVPDSKLLGIIISEDLKWGKHVNNITEKISKRLF